jgi:hypothetical protein
MIANMAENILDETLSIVKPEFQDMECIVMCLHTARQRLDRHIPARTNALKKRTSRQRISKHTSLTIAAVFSVRFDQNDYKKV